MTFEEIFQTLLNEGIDPETAQSIAEDIAAGRVINDAQIREAVQQGREIERQQLQQVAEEERASFGTSDPARAAQAIQYAHTDLANRRVQVEQFIDRYQQELVDQEEEEEQGIRQPLPYDLGLDETPEEAMPMVQDAPIVPQQVAPTARSIDASRSGGSVHSRLTDPQRARQFVVPGDEDPEQFTDLFEQLFKRYGSATGTSTATGKPTQLDGWATRLDSAEMRGLFAPTDVFIATNRRTETVKSDEWNNLVDEALDVTAARRQRVAANVFILELIDSLPAAGEDFVADSRFNAGPINHAEHIYAVNQFVFGKQIDMGALLRGQTIDVGDIQLSDGYVIPDVKLSSVEDYVELINELDEDITSDDPGIIQKLTSLFGLRPQEFAGEFDRLAGFNEETGLGYDKDQARELFEVPLDWMLLHDDRIDSTEAAREELDVLETTINGLGSTTGEDVGGALIRSGYERELESLDPTLYGEDRNLIQSAQNQIGVIQAPGVGVPLYGPEEQAYLDQLNIEIEGKTAPVDLPDLPGPIDRQGYDELNEYLYDNYGGFAFFLDLEEEDLHIGLDNLDRPVDVDSEDAVHMVHILDYLTGGYRSIHGGTDGVRVTTDRGIIEALERTKWYQTTNTSMREWYGDYGANPLEYFQFNVNRPNQMDKVGDIYDSLVNAAQVLMGPGAEQTIGPNRLMMLAAEIDYLGYDTDNETQREMLLERVIRSEEPWQASNADFSAFRLSRDSVETAARRMYLPITEARRNEYAEKMFTGAYTIEDVQAQMRTQALARYGQSNQVRAALEAGLTMEQYFDPYIAEMEKILDRPVDLFEEFPEVVEMVPGDGAARPMSYAEFGEFIRKLPEWGQSDRGQDTARGLVNSIGALFGEVA